jgi:hypothetical protein
VWQGNKYGKGRADGVLTNYSGIYSLHILLLSILLLASETITNNVIAEVASPTTAPPAWQWDASRQKYWYWSDEGWCWYFSDGEKVCWHQAYAPTFAPPTWEWDTARQMYYCWLEGERCWHYADGEKVYTPQRLAIEGC